MPDETSPYEIREAISLLVRAREAKHPEFYSKDRLAATEALRLAVLEAARQARYHVAPGVGNVGEVISFTNASRRYVLVRAFENAGITVGIIESPNPFTPLEDPAIEYLAHEKRWEGTEPGRLPGTRQSAVAAVVDRVIEGLKP